MAKLHVLRVFCGEDGGGGNPLGVFLDGAEIRPEDRQGIAAELGFSETVFVDDAARGEMRIFTPAVELPFAGHPVVGTAWLLARERGAVGGAAAAGGRGPGARGGRADVGRRPPGVDAGVRVRAGRVGGRGGGARGPPEGHDAVGVWAWVDEGAGVVRERVFCPRYGIDEDEATGSAAITLSARLGRELDIRQGAGSRILARPLDDGMVEIGGRVELDEVREHP